MSSFINLMGNDVWSEADIKARLHAEIRSAISAYAETELNRALQGMAMGMHQLTPHEQEQLMLFKAATDRVEILGTAARSDMALLHEALALELAPRRLALPLVVPETEEQRVDIYTFDTVTVVTNQPALDSDAAERLAAQAVIDAASAPALALVLLRNPPPEPIAEPVPVL